LGAEEAAVEETMRLLEQMCMEGTREEGAEELRAGGKRQSPRAEEPSGRHTKPQRV